MARVHRKDFTGRLGKSLSIPPKIVERFKKAHNTALHNVNQITYRNVKVEAVDAFISGQEVNLLELHTLESALRREIAYSKYNKNENENEIEIMRVLYASLDDLYENVYNNYENAIDEQNKFIEEEKNEKTVRIQHDKIVEKQDILSNQLRIAKYSMLAAFASALATFCLMMLEIFRIFK